MRPKACGQRRSCGRGEEERGREQGGEGRKRGQWKRGPRESSLAQVTVEPQPVHAVFLERRHVLTTLRFEARTLYTASACHAFNVGKRDFSQSRKSASRNRRSATSSSVQQLHHESHPTLRCKSVCPHIVVVVAVASFARGTLGVQLLVVCTFCEKFLFEYGRMAG
jgi:hypothetical protein